MPVLSFIVPIYCVEKYIEKCLRSIIEDENFGRHCELILVNDGTPDDSAKIAKSVCAGLANVTILSQANRGLGAARNAGAEVARGDYIWFVDSDDWLPVGAISNVLNALFDHKPHILNIDHVTSLGKVIAPSSVACGAVYNGVDYLAASIVQSPVQYYILDRKLYTEKKLQFEVGRYHEDTLFTPIAVYSASKVVRLGVPCYVYNVREGSIMTGGNNMKHLVDIVYVMKALHVFCEKSVDLGYNRLVFSRYVALCVSGIYNYWRKLKGWEQAEVVRSFEIRFMSRYLWRSRLYKYYWALLSFVFKRLLVRHAGQ